MACKNKFYRIAFESLLLGVNQKLDLPPPMYGYVDVQQNVAFVVIRLGTGSKGYYFQGKRCKCLLQSERDVAKKATLYLLRNFKIVVEDINSEQKDTLTRCASLYREMTTRLGAHGADGVQSMQELPGPIPIDGHLKSLIIDYKEMLYEIIRNLRASATDIEHTLAPCGGYVCWFARNFQRGGGRLEWIFGKACSVLYDAKCNLVKKAILLLHTMYKFEVRDITYHQMFFAVAHCMIAKDDYAAAKARAVRVDGAMGTTDGCVTPTGYGSRIPSSTVPLPPPKKMKAARLSPASCFRKLPVSIEDDLDTIFCSQKPGR